MVTQPRRSKKPMPASQGCHRTGTGQPRHHYHSFLKYRPQTRAVVRARRAHQQGSEQGRGDNPWHDLEVIVESPLAARFTEVYLDPKPWWDAEAHAPAARRPSPLDGEHLQTVDYLARSGRPAVVIAASGMVSGGRVVNYLKRILGNSRHDVLFTGYQAVGTPGRTIQEYGRHWPREVCLSQRTRSHYASHTMPLHYRLKFEISGVSNSKQQLGVHLSNPDNHNCQ